MGQNQGITPGHNESCSSQKPSFRDPSWLRGYMCTQGNVPLQVRCEKRNWIIGLKEDKDPEELPYINDLTASLPCSSSLGGVHTLPLWLCVCLASVSGCSPSCSCAVSLITNFVPAFTVSATMINEFFTGGKDSGTINF